MAIPPGANAGWTAQPGVFGNLVGITLVSHDGGPDLTITVTGTTIELDIGTSAGGTVTNITWAAMAVLFNADAGAFALCTMEGNANNSIPTALPGSFTLTGGSAVLGRGQFFSAPDAEPPAPAPPVVTLTFKGQKVYA